MGKGFSKNDDSVEARYCRPQGLYPKCEWDEKTLRKLVLDKKLAPFFPGNQPGHEGDAEECPICFMTYPALNRSKCCKQGICSECFLQIKRPKARESSTCPFCNTAKYAVTFSGALSKKDKQDKEIEEQRTIEAQIRARNAEDSEAAERKAERERLAKEEAEKESGEVSGDGGQAQGSEQAGTAPISVPQNTEATSASPPPIGSPPAQYNPDGTLTLPTPDGPQRTPEFDIPSAEQFYATSPNQWEPYDPAAFESSPVLPNYPLGHHRHYRGGGQRRSGTSSSTSSRRSRSHRSSGGSGMHGGRRDLQEPTPVAFSRNHLENLFGEGQGISRETIDSLEGNLSHDLESIMMAEAIRRSLAESAGAATPATEGEGTESPSRGVEETEETVVTPAVTTDPSSVLESGVESPLAQSSSTAALAAGNADSSAGATNSLYRTPEEQEEHDIALAIALSLQEAQPEATPEETPAVVATEAPVDGGQVEPMATVVTTTETAVVPSAQVQETTTATDTATASAVTPTVSTATTTSTAVTVDEGTRGTVESEPVPLTTTAHDTGIEAIQEAWGEVAPPLPTTTAVDMPAPVTDNAVAVTGQGMGQTSEASALPADPTPVPFFTPSTGISNDTTGDASGDAPLIVFDAEPVAPVAETVVDTELTPHDNSVTHSS